MKVKRYIAASFLFLCSMAATFSYPITAQAMSLDEYCDRLNNPFPLRDINMDIDPRFVDANFTEELSRNVETSIMNRFLGVQACIMNEVDYAFEASFGRLMNHVDRMADAVEGLRDTFIPEMVDTARHFRDRIACSSAAIAGSAMGTTGIIEDAKGTYDEIYAYYDGVIAIRESSERIRQSQNTYTGDPVIDRQIDDRIDEERRLLRREVDGLPVMNRLDEAQYQTDLLNREVGRITRMVSFETDQIADRMADIQRAIAGFTDVLTVISEEMCKSTLKEERENIIAPNTLPLKDDGCNFMRQEVNHTRLCMQRIETQIFDGAPMDAVPTVNPDDGCNETRKRWNQTRADRKCIQLVEREIANVGENVKLPLKNDDCDAFREAHNRGEDMYGKEKCIPEGQTPPSTAGISEDDLIEIDTCPNKNLQQILKILEKLQQVLVLLSTLEEIEEFYNDIQKIKQLYERSIGLYTDIMEIYNASTAIMTTVETLLASVETLSAILSGPSFDDIDTVAALAEGREILRSIKSLSGYVCRADDAFEEFRDIITDINRLQDELERDIVAIENMTADFSDVWALFRQFKRLREDTEHDGPRADTPPVPEIDQQAIVQSQAALDEIKDNSQQLQENAEQELSWWEEGSEFLLNDIFSNDNIALIRNFGQAEMASLTSLTRRIPRVADLTEDALDSLWELERGEAACRAGGDDFIRVSNTFANATRNALQAATLMDYALQAAAEKETLILQLQADNPIEHAAEIARLETEIATHHDDFDRYQDAYNTQRDLQQQAIDDIAAEVAAESDPERREALQDLLDVMRMAEANPDILSDEGGICLSDENRGNIDQTLADLRHDFAQKAFYVCDIEPLIDARATTGTGSGAEGGLNLPGWVGNYTGADLEACMGDVGIFDGFNNQVTYYNYPVDKSERVIHGQRYRCNAAKARAYWQETGATAQSVIGQYEDVSRLVDQAERLNLNGIRGQISGLQALINRASDVYSYITRVERLINMIEQTEQILERGPEAFDDLGDEVQACIPSVDQIADEIVIAIEDTIRDYLIHKLVGLFGRAGRDLSYMILPSPDYRPGDPLDQWLDDNYFNAVQIHQQHQLANADKLADPFAITQPPTELGLAGIVTHYAAAFGAVSNTSPVHQLMAGLYAGQMKVDGLDNFTHQPAVADIPTAQPLLASNGSPRQFESFTQGNNLVLSHLGRAQEFLKTGFDTPFRATLDVDNMSPEIDIDMGAIMKLPKVKTSGFKLDIEKSYGDDFKATMHSPFQFSCGQPNWLSGEGMCWYRVWMCWREGPLGAIKVCSYIPTPLPIPEMSMSYTEPVAHVEISPRQGTSYLGNMMFHNFGDENIDTPLLSGVTVGRGGVNWSSAGGDGVPQARVWGISPHSRAMSGVSPVSAPMTLACDIAHRREQRGEPWHHSSIKYALGLGTPIVNLLMRDIAAPFTHMNDWRAQWFQDRAPMLGVMPYSLAALYITEENRQDWNPRVSAAPSIFPSDLGEDPERYEAIMGVPYNREAILRHTVNYRKEFFTQYVDLPPSGIPSDYLGENSNIDFAAVRAELQSLTDVDPSELARRTTRFAFLYDAMAAISDGETLSDLIVIAENDRLWNRLVTHYSAPSDSGGDARSWQNAQRNIQHSGTNGGHNQHLADLCRNNPNHPDCSSDDNFLDDLQSGVNTGVDIIGGGLGLVQDGMDWIDENTNFFGTDVCVPMFGNLCRNKCDAGVQDQTNICLGSWGALFPRNGHTFFWDYSNPIKTMALLAYRAFDRAIEHGYIQQYKMQPGTGSHGQGFREGNRWWMSFEWPIQTRKFRVGDNLSELRWHPNARKSRRAGLIATMWKDTQCCMQQCMNYYPWALADEFKPIDLATNGRRVFNIVKNGIEVFPGVPFKNNAALKKVAQNDKDRIYNVDQKY